MIFSFCLALPIGAGSCIMIRNGMNRTPIHATYTGFGMNVIDICMFILYYFGLSHIFNIFGVKIALYVAGMIILGRLSYGCFKKSHIDITEHKDGKKHSIKESLKDGIMIALVPSSIIYWSAIYGVFLSKFLYADHIFITACAGILMGFFINNIAYGLIVKIIHVFANDKVVRYVNYFSGTVLGGFVVYFAYQLCLLLL